MKKSVDLYLRKVTRFLESETFEQKTEKYTWWILGFSVLYFVGRILVSVIFGI